ncbi:hypothetical protein CFN78_27525 [Amycolatopsis antarctica]|uniref:Uncharacterized protein n=2 Tax=Amycolatopsis antarctica TaxID=1854586 RepID=A0A263CV87_9PSEU|nr:hypothetical protein CFN78_27525 [Amycolatopsis antarctica]
MPQSTDSHSVAKGGGEDVKTFATAALLTFSAGMLVLIGTLLIGGFGTFLGIVAAVLGVVWWRSVNEKVFPRTLPNSSMITLAVATGVLGLLVVFLI